MVIFVSSPKPWLIYDQFFNFFQYFISNFALPTCAKDTITTLSPTLSLKSSFNNNNNKRFIVLWMQNASFMLTIFGVWGLESNKCRYPGFVIIPSHRFFMFFSTFRLYVASDMKFEKVNVSNMSFSETHVMQAQAYGYGESLALMVWPDCE